MSKFKSFLSWFPNEGSLFALFNAAVLLFLLYAIEHDVVFSSVILLVLIGLNLFWGLANHDFIVEEEGLK